MIKEKPHRLPREFYRGQISVSFTLCLRKNLNHTLNEHSTVSALVDILSSITAKSNCIVPVYCFMPDHQHLIVTGISNDSNIWKIIVSYKQMSGFWMAQNRPKIKWQKDFYDHIIRSDKNIVVQVNYILDNPVRKGIVSSWEEYPFKGSIGCRLEDVLNGIT